MSTTETEVLNKCIIVTFQLRRKGGVSQRGLFEQRGRKRKVEKARILGPHTIFIRDLDIT